MRPTSSPLQHFHKIFIPSINNETYHVKANMMQMFFIDGGRRSLLYFWRTTACSFRHIAPSNPLARKMKTKCASWVVMTTADTTHDPQSQHTWKSYASRTLTTVVDKHWLVLGPLQPVQVAELNLWRKASDCNCTTLIITATTRHRERFLLHMRWSDSPSTLFHLCFAAEAVWRRLHKRYLR